MGGKFWDRSCRELIAAACLLQDRSDGKNDATRYTVSHNEAISYALSNETNARV
jgi:hypothetical protein